MKFVSCKAKAHGFSMVCISLDEVVKVFRADAKDYSKSDSILTRDGQVYECLSLDGRNDRFFDCIVDV